MHHDRQFYVLQTKLKYDEMFNEMKKKTGLYFISITKKLVAEVAK